MADTLQVDPREALGSRNSMKLRAAGQVPAVLYGHKEEPVTLSVSGSELRKALSHNAKLVNLTGAVSGQAVVQELQWDTFHRDLLHIDLLRVAAGEKINVTVPVELKGEAAGIDEGGVVEQVLLQLELEAPPSAIPEVLHIDVTDLHMGGAVSAGDVIDLPEGAKLLTAADEMVAHCVQPSAEPSLDDVGAPAGDPEVIGKKESEDKE